MLIDTHTHLYLPEFHDEMEKYIDRCKKQNISKLYLPNIDASSIDEVHKLADDYPGYCIPMMGLHPCYVKKDYRDQLSIIEKNLAERKYAAVGEIGIDLHWDKTFKEEQVDAFRRQISLAKQYKIPIVIHSREAQDLTIEIVTEMKDENLRGIFHCFSGSIEQAKQIMDIGDFYMGIGGVLTYKNSGLDKVVENIPLSYLVLETDSPYLTPTPHRGKRNESSYIIFIAEKLALVKNTTLEEVSRLTSDNAAKVFQD
jgi:TatD DNase family protein